MNIRCGNTLVGCVSTEDLKQMYAGDMIVAQKLLGIGDKAVVLRESYRRFQRAQDSKLDDKVADFKGSLQRDTDALRHELDCLFSQADSQETGWNLNHWRRSHKPFHWMAEFPEAILGGGFHVVIGNPPFIAKRKVVPHLYRFQGFETDNAPDIYAPCMERAASLLSQQGRFAMIAPISLVSGLKFDSLRQALSKQLPMRWVTVFDLIPGHLFKAKVCPAITMGTAGPNNNGTGYTSNLRRWRPAYRPFLFSTTRFSRSTPTKEMKSVWPLIGDGDASGMLQKLRDTNRTVGHYVRRHGKYKVGRKTVRNL